VTIDTRGRDVLDAAHSEALEAPGGGGWGDKVWRAGAGRETVWAAAGAGLESETVGRAQGVNVNNLGATPLAVYQERRMADASRGLQGGAWRGSLST
jgi:hypothetical protein